MRRRCTALLLPIAFPCSFPRQGSPRNRVTFAAGLGGLAARVLYSSGTRSLTERWEGVHPVTAVQ